MSALDVRKKKWRMRGRNRDTMCGQGRKRKGERKKWKKSEKRRKIRMVENNASRLSELEVKRRMRRRNKDTWCVDKEEREREEEMEDRRQCMKRVKGRK